MTITTFQDKSLILLINKSLRQLFVVVLMLCCCGFISAAVSPFKLVIKTTADNENFELGLISGGTYDATIDWGDTNSQPQTTDTNPIHNYTTAGTYTITITGTATNKFPGVKFQSVNPTKVYEIKQWGNHTWSTMFNAFNGCTNLTITATDHADADTGSVWDFRNSFYGCSSLTAFPLINTSGGTIFSSAWFGCSSLTSFALIDTSLATNLSSTFSGCTSLTSFPAIDTGKVTTFSSTWENCSGLTSFPSINTSIGQMFNSTWASCSNLTGFPALNMSEATNVSGAWSYCSKLTSFPIIDLGKATTINSAWRGCTSLASFPALATTLATDFGRAWQGCNSLTSFPLLPNTANAADLQYAWYDCTNLTSFPLINTAMVTDFRYAWGNCNELTSFAAIATNLGTNFVFTWGNCNKIANFPSLNMRAMTDGTNCFQGVTIPTTTYSNLLIDLAANNPNNSITFSGGNSRYDNSALNARETTLPTTKLWTITDGGRATPVITSSIAANATVGVNFSYQMTASDSPTSFNATGLPAPLTVNPGTGLISGIPAMPAGLHNITLEATNGLGTGPSRIMVLSVTSAGAPVITSAGSVSATKGVPFNYQIVATNSPTSYNTTVLPLNGLSLNAAGLISGTPSSAETMEMVIQATNANGTGVKMLTITVNNPTPGGGGGGSVTTGDTSSTCGLGSGASAMLIIGLGFAFLSFRRNKYRI